MRIGMIDCDEKNSKNPFPNLALMKISAYHKQNNDVVEWYDHLYAGHYDKVYVSKVFSFSKDYEYPINADVVEYGGSGFAISLVDGKEIYDKSKDKDLPNNIEHIYPDYSFGFMSKGCPRGCDFCHVKNMQGIKAYKVADLSEFWDGQKYIKLLDPNVTALKEWKDIFQQLIDSKAYIDFTQGLDIRLMTEEKAAYLKQIKVKQVHFAWDRYEDKDIVVPKLKKFKEITQWDKRKMSVYVLCGDRERKVLDTDLERIYTIKELGYHPYVMVYDKKHLKRGHELKKLQRWVNNRIIWEKISTFEEYKISKI